MDRCVASLWKAGEGNTSSFRSPSDLRAAHVFALPRIYLCSALDRVLRTKRCSYKCPKSERVQLHGNPDGAGVLEPGDTQHPSADGPQQSGEFTKKFSLLARISTCILTPSPHTACLKDLRRSVI